ncbi:MAG: hypothetical protein QOH58_2249 [Thermoleophilaceae bacterium]|jgi:FtsP/CotA-like multicopper oxidase with cupredoxin domain|nr:hypothetical protein [Thermoleophilaceae bacterium]
MSTSGRIALVVAALAVAVAAFLIARPGDDEDSKPAAETAPAQTEAQTETETAAEAAPPPRPEVTRIRIEGGQVAGGPKTIEAQQGDTVRIVVSSDAPDELHLHGYDITREAGPGRPARFRFKANAEGAFELESHTAEDAGNDPLVARLLIGPS